MRNRPGWHRLRRLGLERERNGQEHIGDCALHGTQNHWVQSYVTQHLLGQAGETAKMEAPSNYAFDRTRRIDRSTPTLQ